MNRPPGVTSKLSLPCTCATTTYPASGATSRKACTMAVSVWFCVTCLLHVGALHSGHCMTLVTRKQPRMHSWQKECWHGRECGSSNRSKQREQRISCARRSIRAPSRAHSATDVLAVPWLLLLLLLSAHVDGAAASAVAGEPQPASMCASSSESGTDASQMGHETISPLATDDDASPCLAPASPGQSPLARCANTSALRRRTPHTGHCTCRSASSCVDSWGGDGGGSGGSGRGCGGGDGGGAGGDNVSCGGDGVCCDAGGAKRSRWAHVSR